MTKPRWLSRRKFVKGAGMTALAAQTQWLRAAIEPARRLSIGLAFVGAMGETQGIHVFAMEGERWRLLQVVPSEAPVSLALHPSGESLYVLNGLREYQGLPCGTVEAYKVNSQTGQLTLLGRRPLALSATAPRHLAVSPDGMKLVVAVHGGGAYNVLPILSGGGVGRVCGVLKEAGCGPVAKHQESAHPQTVLFDSTGKRVIAADLGCDRVSVLSIEDGLEVQARYALPAGSGPRHVALHPAEHLLYVDHALAGSVSGFRYDARAGKILEQLVSVRGEFGDALALHPGGDFLYSASDGEVAAWRIEPATGALHWIQSQNMGTDTVREMSLLPGGSAAMVLTANGVELMNTDSGSGRLGDPRLVAPAPEARSIAIL